MTPAELLHEGPLIDGFKPLLKYLPLRVVERTIAEVRCRFMVEVVWVWMVVLSTGQAKHVTQFMRNYSLELVLSSSAVLATNRHIVRHDRCKPR